MAAKSDFAQKLLHDLRLRKERMGASQGSTRTNATTRDAYRNQGLVQNGGSKTMNQQLISSKGSNRAPNMKESSQQIVSYAGGQHQRSESFGDLSMAFTYALNNGEKLMNVDFSRSGNTNTMIDFLNQIGRRSLDAGYTRNQARMTSLVKHRASNSGGVVTPALTTIQIKEISKGVQNLYEIIRSSSNGTNVNRYSMEVGKELLKGAKGLEESLRMLVNLQEASELMVTPQRKSRVTLLEVDEDDGDDRYERSKSVDQNKVDLPRFSFDKPSRRSNLALTDGSNKLPTHRKSASCSGESVRSVSNVKSTSGHSEKGRISNVIAKLMGLDEVVELKNAKDSNTNTINKISRPAKDGQVSLNNQKSQQVHDSNKDTFNKSSRPVTNALVLLNDRKSQQILDSKPSNNRLDQISEKKERQLPNGESKEKINSKRRSPEVAANIRVEKKKTIRTEKSNEIKLVPRNNKIQEAEKRIKKSKQDSQQIKQIKHTNPPSNEPKVHTFEQNTKAKETSLKVQEPERSHQKIMPVTRKKVDSTVVSRIEAPRTKDEVLKPRNRMLNNLTTPSKHKLSVLKETKRKDTSIHSKSDENGRRRTDLKKTESKIQLANIVSLQSGAELVSGLENARPPLMFNDDILLPIVSECENEIKSDPKITSEIIVDGSSKRIIESSNIPKNKPKKNTFYPSIQVVLTENEKQLKEILIKDQLFLSTTEALFKLNIPVGFLHVDDHRQHNNESKLKLDCAYEILKRKARSQELSAHPYIKPSIGVTSIRFLDELVKQLYKDLESLTLYGRDASNEYDEADYLHHMLDRDIHNKCPDINSFWDFGWNITTFTFVEKDEFVNDVQQYVLHILVDEIVDDLLSMSLPS